LLLKVLKANYKYEAGNRKDKSGISFYASEQERYQRLPKSRQKDLRGRVKGQMANDGPIFVCLVFYLFWAKLGFELRV
jgi:hypothetical protein